MKVKQLNNSAFLFFAIIMLALAFHYFTSKKHKVSRNDVLEAVITSESLAIADFYFIISGALIDEYVLVDIRDEESFEESHFESAINIPLDKVLDKEHRKIFKDERHKILIAKNEADAHFASVLLTGMAYENIYVLPGGYLFASAFVSKDFDPAYGHYSEDKTKFDYSRFMDVTIDGVKKEAESEIPEIETQTIIVEGGC